MRFTNTDGTVEVTALARSDQHRYFALRWIFSAEFTESSESGQRARALPVWRGWDSSRLTANAGRPDGRTVVRIHCVRGGGGIRTPVLQSRYGSSPGASGDLSLGPSARTGALLGTQLG